MNQIVIHQLSKKYKNQTVLKDINVSFQSGYVYGIVGLNGSGKSELIKQIVGLESPTEGFVAFSNEDMKLGIVIDGASLFLQLSAFENLKFLAGVNGKFNEEAVQNALKRVFISADDKRKLKKYSMGMRKRVVLAQAIMDEPDALILDEPTNALDEKGILIFYDIIKEYKKNGKLVILTSHYKQDIEQLCDVVYTMKEGILCEEEL